MYERGLPDISAVAPSVTPAPTIMTRRLSFKACLSSDQDLAFTRSSLAQGFVLNELLSVSELLCNHFTAVPMVRCSILYAVYGHGIRFSALILVTGVLSAHRSLQIVDSSFTYNLYTIRMLVHPQYKILLVRSRRLNLETVYL